MTAPRSLPRSDLEQLLGLFEAKRFSAMELPHAACFEQYPEAGTAGRRSASRCRHRARNAVANLQEAVGLLPGDAEPRGQLEAHLGQERR